MSKKMDVDSEIDFCNISTSDGKLYRVEKSMVNRWQTISDMLEFSDDTNDDIPLPNVSSEVFELLKKWDNEHSYLKKGEGIPIKNNYGYECFDLKDEPRAFFKMAHSRGTFLLEKSS
ncbi:hypothetical protein G9C98_008550 [Cotesia typhae]|uniref:SKP1 component POZ domain-containing protein n=1 Tax=Cotesia typhae TaxID=2053667 RepID=A0A8J5V4Y0_9HYME|nr:hypothetical protein G9C98_008550 [Cotesia typhae]